ncbi:MAG TPA: hypothetical protein DDW52_27510 [Planctomycetaceae bacterium]|nr:hypothetical protein [Planctomycetaceae bacterium]
MKVRCPHCQKTLSLSNVEAEQFVRCSCGKKLRVPAAVGSGTQKTCEQNPAHRDPNRSTVVKCDCGKSLRIPSKAFGKQVKCTCGIVLPIAQDGSRKQKGEELFPATGLAAASAQTSPAGTDAPYDDWLGDLPEVGAAPPPTAYAPAQYSPPQGNHSGASATKSSATKSSAKSSAANAYLAAAEEERHRGADPHSQVDWSFNGGLLGGIGMMIGAVVWFFAGLAAGYIFFYPPILLIGGAITVIRSIGD